MDRRRFLRRALFGAGIVASGGGIDLLEAIAEPRRYWQGADFGSSVLDRDVNLFRDLLLRRLRSEPRIIQLMESMLPPPSAEGYGFIVEWPV